MSRRDISPHTIAEHLQRGDLPRAEKLCRRYTERHPRDPGGWAMLGHILGRRGELSRAERALRRSLDIRGDNPQARLDLGRVLRRLGRAEAALELLAPLARSRPAPDTALELGLALGAADRGEEAIEVLAQALARFDTPPLRFNLANLLRERGEVAAAREHYQRLLDSGLRDAPLLTNLGLARHGLGDPDGALAAFREALALDPEALPALNNAGALLASLGRHGEARTLLEASLARDPSQADIALRLADVERELEAPQAAEARLRALLTAHPGHSGAHQGLVALLEEQNRLPEARAALEAAREAVGPGPELALLAARLERRAGDFEAARARLETIDAGAGDADFERRWCYERGQVLDRLGDPAGAWAAWGRRAELAAAANPRDSLFPGLVSAARERLDRPLPRAAADGSEVPVFLFGFPRSGTTLADRLLRERAALESIEERGVLDRLIGELGFDADPGVLRRRYLALLAPFRRSALRPLDRQPMGFLYLPALRAAFPEAPVLFCQRHPVDVVLSCFMQDFRANALSSRFNAVEDIVALYRESSEFWLSWAERHPDGLVTVRYEELVAAPRDTMATAAVQLGLALRAGEDSPAAAPPPASRTASYHQVNQPVYRHAAGRWERYREQLAPWLPQLEALAARLGYAPP